MYAAFIIAVMLWYGGNSPDLCKRIMERRLVVELDCTLKDMQQLEKGTVDFFTFSYYGTSCVTTHEGVEKDGAAISASV